MDVELKNPESQLFINGAWRCASDRGVAEVECPADGTSIASISVATPDDIDRAVRAADDAFNGAWRDTPARERGRMLSRLADLIERDLEVIAKLEALEIGRPANEPKMVDIPSAIVTLRYFAGWADKMDGRTLASPDHFGRPTHAYTIREPVGVVGAILPWNAPTMICCWKLAPALAAGCTLVIKPALEAPLAVLYLGRLIEEAGFPPGVVNIVPGAGRVAGDALVGHPKVSKVTFTGSPEVGRMIARKAADTFKPTTLELGGKAPQLIFPDVDVKATAEALALGIFSNQGEICAAGSRIIVHEAIEAELVDALREEAEKRVLGHPLDGTTTMGSLISKKQMDTVAEYISSGLNQGATLVTGGAPIDGPGFFMRPTVFSGVNNAMRIAQEEIFGPVAAVMTFSSEEDAVAMANDSRYGLSANIFTESLRTAHRVAARVDAGTVWVNGGGTPDPRAVWGGSGLSGVGRELGLSALQSHTHEKAVCVLL
ncbi:aldehyde dehydrogenase family protein [Psychromarinibacter sp. C21-152]|uniref:Aldehyde dehydrogenase family protein n=1 Tax=Psychromarinibacter sediminicola TaxID=3033385 RepID=A0AAE3NR66_9RHOB|nr:aldehyde dehydrogenase family protein [Psychromarinibacter sediminicola]MDF0600979.1 aldehyde dehydrogenase family protein [Psychromarinibacter sediminicola]